jgi:hypothetical protein
MGGMPSAPVMMTVDIDEDQGGIVRYTRKPTREIRLPMALGLHILTVFRGGIRICFFRFTYVYPETKMTINFAKFKKLNLPWCLQLELRSRARDLYLKNLPHPPFPLDAPEPESSPANPCGRVT